MAQKAVWERTAPSPPSRMNYEEFLAGADEDTWAEWVDGEVIFMSPVTDEHADLAGWLLAILRPFVKTHQLGIVRSEPVQMKTGPGLPGRSPDLLCVASENLGRRKKTHISGPADLVSEIVSPDSVARDRETKYSEYERGGVREYRLIDDKRIFRSVVLAGLWLEVDWLWQDPLTPVLTVLKEWRLI